MSENYLHGVRVTTLNDGPRPIRTASSGIIGIVGTAPNASEEDFPLNTPVLLMGSRTKAKKLGAKGTLPRAIDGIFDQVGAVVVVVRVKEELTSDGQLNLDGTIGHIINSRSSDSISEAVPLNAGDSGTPDSSDTPVDNGPQNNAYTIHDYKGIDALIAAETFVNVKPRILIVPGFSQNKSVADKLIFAAKKLRGFAILDGPNTTDEDAIKYRDLFGGEDSRRAEIVDPWFKVKATDGQYIDEPPSARHAGVMARVHNEKGFWHVNSNQEIRGVQALCRPVVFRLDDIANGANHLNGKDVTTTIMHKGFRVWGDRTLSDDKKWAFKNAVITHDLIAESLLDNHLWAVDRNITKTYVDDVMEGVNNYLAHLTQIGAIAGGRCWVDPELNTPDQLTQGKVYFDYDFTPYPPAECVTFRCRMVNGYLTEVL